MTAKISVIVPVYNAERTLERCIKSILNQSFGEFELILINDGSTDNSWRICQKYNSLDSRIKIINQDNKGVSFSRNVGLKKAKFKYVMFIDADDWIENNMFQLLIDTIESSNAGLVMCGYKRIDYEGNKVNSEVYIKPNAVSNIKKVHLYRQIYNYFDKGLMNPLWNKLFRNDIIKNYQIKFDENLSLGEDLLFNLEYLSKIRMVSLIDDSLYNYVVLNDGKSLSTKYNPKRLESQILIYTRIIESLKEVGEYNKENKSYFRSSFSSAISGSIKNYLRKSNESNEEMYAFLKKVCNDSNVINNILLFVNGSLVKNFIALLVKLRAYKFLVKISKFKI